MSIDQSSTDQKSVHLLFSAMIDQLAVQRFFTVVAAAMQDGVNDIHILLHTMGGNVADGVCLYNFFESLPISVSVYNCGSISSAGVLAYLGGGNRYTASTGTFMIHRSTAAIQSANSDTVQARIPSLIMDDNRIETILRENTRLSEDQWAAHRAGDLWLNAKDAITAGIAFEERDFSVSAGSRLYNVFQ